MELPTIFELSNNIILSNKSNGCISEKTHSWASINNIELHNKASQSISVQREQKLYIRNIILIRQPENSKLSFVSLLMQSSL